MIGSGIFLIPASLAVYGNIGLLGWVVSFLGALVRWLLTSNILCLIKLPPHTMAMRMILCFLENQR